MIGARSAFNAESGQSLVTSQPNASSPKKVSDTSDENAFHPNIIARRRLGAGSGIPGYKDNGDVALR
jgi:hypothetical protein